VFRAHCDDIEIGCGATILRLVENYSNIEFYWVVLVQTRKEKKKKHAKSFFKS